MLNAMLLLRAMDAIPDDLIARCAERFPSARRPLRSRRRALTIALIAAALALLLAACGWVAYRAAMGHRVPQPGDPMRYYLRQTAPDGTTAQGEFNFESFAMTMQFVTEERGCACAFRLGEQERAQEGWRQSYEFASFLKGLGDERFVPHPIPYRQALRRAGLSEEEAKTWFRTASYHVPERDENLRGLRLRIDIYDGPCLHGIDLIFGFPKGEAELVREGTLGEYQLLEFTVERSFTANGEEQTERDCHLLLFHPTGQYLLHFCCLEGSLSYAEMEEIAGRLEVLQSGLKYTVDHGEMNFSMADLANG